MNSISNTYKHITYIGSISSSTIIGFLCIFLENPNSPIGKTIFNLALLKSFFLYDSTIEVFIHHAVMLLFLYLNNPYIYTFNISNPNTIQYVKLGYGIYSTSVFSNLNLYIKHPTYTPIFKYLNYITFLIFRFKFNQAVWNYHTIQMLHSYYNHDHIKAYLSYSVMLVISFINVYWTYIILRNNLKKHLLRR